AKATNDEVVLWHRRLGHVNLKNINKLVKGNLVRGLPSKTFKLDHSCLACRKGKQHRASCKKIEERTVREPLELLHMDLFGPVSVERLWLANFAPKSPNEYTPTDASQTFGGDEGLLDLYALNREVRRLKKQTLF
ncbi:putative ribonuclease H-like domain-containing protein, partial [Tanacetum coccineum]